MRMSNFFRNADERPGEMDAEHPTVGIDHLTVVPEPLHEDTESTPESGGRD